MFSITLLALVSGLPATSGPEWQPSYRSALSQASAQHKPVVVFIAQGGVEQAVAGNIPAEATSLLKQGYVCVSVDTTTPQGAQVAESFRMNQGVVISDRDGQHQALRYEGTITPEQLAENLRRLQSLDTAATTERISTLSDAAPVVSAPIVSAPAVTYTPVPTYTPTIVPTMNYVQPTFMSGGCASGNCGMIQNYAPMTYGGCANGRCFR